MFVNICINLILYIIYTMYIVYIICIMICIKYIIYLYYYLISTTLFLAPFLIEGDASLWFGAR